MPKHTFLVEVRTKDWAKGRNKKEDRVLWSELIQIVSQYEASLMEQRTFWLLDKFETILNERKPHVLSVRKVFVGLIPGQDYYFDWVIVED